MSRGWILLLPLALAACGKKEDLRPLPGAELPQKPATARAQPTIGDLLQPGPEARPERDGQLLKRSEPRTADPFDLPPPPLKD